MVDNELCILVSIIMLMSNNYDDIIRIVLSVSLHKINLNLRDLLKLLKIALVSHIVFILRAQLE